MKLQFCVSFFRLFRTFLPSNGDQTLLTPLNRLNCNFHSSKEMQNSKQQTLTLAITHTYTLFSLSFSLSLTLSHTHTHTYTHVQTRTNTPIRQVVFTVSVNV